MTHCSNFLPHHLIGAIWLGVCAAVAAQPAALNLADQGAPTFTVFTAEDGLSDDVWNTVEVGADGFVWAGSASELARFDGYRWTLWPTLNARSLVRHLARFPDGALWAVFEREGLARWADDQWQFQSTNQGALFRFSQTVSADGQSEAWVAGQNGLWKRAGQAWIADPGNGAATLDAEALVETQSLFGAPRQWLLTRSGLFYRPVASGARVHPWVAHSDPMFRNFPGSDMALSIDQGREELWILSYGEGLVRLRDDGMRVWRSAKGELPTEALYAA